MRHPDLTAGWSFLAFRSRVRSCKCHPSEPILVQKAGHLVTAKATNMQLFANTDRRMLVTKKYTLIFSLLFFCGSLLSFISSAAAQPCTPVVYAFRHAEDFGRNLTLVGRQHADLYTAMVDGFGAAQNYCPVGYVYSMYYTNPDGSGGTNNPFQTAQPLANSACIDRVLPKCMLETMHIGDCIGALCTGSV